MAKSDYKRFQCNGVPSAILRQWCYGTYIRAGILDTGALAGSAMQIGAGYEGMGKGAAHGGSFVNFLVRSHREGERNSRSEVDLGWRHINY